MDPRQQPIVFLRPWRSPLFQLMAGLFLFVAIGGFFITNFFAFTVFYQFLVVFHTLLGLLLLAPFCYYMLRHGWIQWHLGPRWPKVTGIVVSVTMSAALVTGLGLVLYSARSELAWLVRAHMVTSVAGVLALGVHLVQGWLVDPVGRMFKARIAGPRVLAAALAPVLLVVVAAATYVHEPYYGPIPEGYAYKRTSSDGPFFPSEARTVSDQMITLAAVANSQSCGVSGCHTDIVHQWEQSLHRLSFHEPIYRASELDIIKERGMPTARWCASCHEPVVLMSGNMDLTSKLDPNTLTGHKFDSQFNEGISCVACHGIARNDSLRGVGSFVFGAPDYYIYTARNEFIPRQLNKLLIRVKPQPHRETFLQPVLKESRACMSCHKVFMDENVNRYRFILGQNQFDSWRTGPWSQENFLTFRTQPLRKCVDCHMPQMPVSGDIARNNGTVAGHAFPGANLIVPRLFNNPEQEERIRENKKDRLRVRIAEVQAGDTPDFTFHTRPYFQRPVQFQEAAVAPGQTLNVAITVTNTGIGHRFPTGTNDAKDVWLEFTAVDGAGRTIFHSGYLDPDGTIDPDSHFYRVILLDQNADWIQTRRVWEMRAKAYARTIPPGAADLAIYRFTLPGRLEGPLTLTAQVHYRKLSKPFMEHVVERLEPRVRDQPVVTMGQDSLTVGIGRPAGERPADQVVPMLVDYGIGLFREGNTEFARRAWLTALDLAPTNGRLYTDIGMTYYKESEYDLAAEWFDKAKEAVPDDARVEWFRALMLERSGRYQEALAQLDQVVARYPRSDKALFEQGKIRAWLGDTQGARAAYEAVIAIDPNQAGAYHGLAQVYRQEGLDLEARALGSAFDRLRQDTTTGRWLNAFYTKEPWIAMTTRRGYVHDRGRTLAQPITSAAGE